MASKTNTAITYSILVIWGMLLVFGILTLMSPDWLVALSNPGRNIEAITHKTAGDQALKSKNYPLAIAQYKNALKIVPDLKGAIANLAIAYQRSGEYEKAITSLTYLLSKDPEYPEVIHYNLGEIYERTKNTQKALASYLKAAETASFPEKSYQKTGQLYMYQEEWHLAIENFQKAVHHRQNIYNAYRGMLLSQQNVIADTSEAHASISEQLKSLKLETLANDYDTTVFDEQLARDEALAKTYNNIGYCFAKQENYKEAILYFEIALSMFPNYTEALNNMRFVKQKL